MAWWQVRDERVLYLVVIIVVVVVKWYVAVNGMWWFGGRCAMSEYVSGEGR